MAKETYLVAHNKEPELLAIQGKEDCADLRCTRSGGTYDPETGAITHGKCIGWHCPYCGEPTSSQGHNCLIKEAKE